MFFLFLFCFFWRQKENTELLLRLWETLGKGFFFQFWPPSRRARPDGLWREARKEKHFKGDVSTLLLIAETLKLLTRSGAPFLGLLRLPTQRLSLADSQICMLCVCISYLKQKKRKEKSCRAIGYIWCDRNLFTILPFLSFTTNVCPYIFDWKCQLETFCN